MSHLTYDIDTMTRFCLKEMLRLNRKVKKKKLKHFLRDILEHLNSNNNEYHNVVHTFEVFQMITLFIQQTGKHFTRREKTVLQISALCHDFGHLGISNEEWTMETVFQNISQRSMNSLYSDEQISYNEVMHVDKASMVLDKHRILKNDEMNTLNRLIISTDLKKNDHFFANMDTMILLIKLADLSHTLRPFHVHLYWVFKNQSERSQRGTPPDIKWLASDTLAFINMFVQPLVNEFERRFGKIPNNHLESNIATWKKYINNDIYK